MDFVPVTIIHLAGDRHKMRYEDDALQELAEAIGALEVDAVVTEAAVVQWQGSLTIGWGQLTGVPTSFPPAAHTHAAADTISGQFAPDRISEPSVTRHEAALQIREAQVYDNFAVIDSDDGGPILDVVTGTLIRDLAEALV